MPVVLPLKLTVQVPPLSTQLALAGVGVVPVPVALTVNVPVGVEAVPPEVSLTVTVQLLATVGSTGLAQLTVVEVTRLLTAAVVFPELPTWLASPG